MSQGLRIRRILDYSDLETYVAGPQDFVELFAKADYVFTDSYHACCFSLIFEKDFKVLNRAGYEGSNSLNSRMQTLMRLFDLEDTMGTDTTINRINYRVVPAKLQQYQKQSLSWLAQIIAEE